MLLPRGTGFSLLGAGGSDLELEQRGFQLAIAAEVHQPLRASSGTNTTRLTGWRSWGAPLSGMRFETAPPSPALLSPSGRSALRVCGWGLPGPRKGAHKAAGGVRMALDVSARRTGVAYPPLVLARSFLCGYLRLKGDNFGGEGRSQGEWVGTGRSLNFYNGLSV